MTIQYEREREREREREKKTIIPIIKWKIKTTILLEQFQNHRNGDNIALTHNYVQWTLTSLA
jgi:hypothetical protein